MQDHPIQTSMGLNEDQILGVHQFLHQLNQGQQNAQHQIP
jgi:hypothetical protein